METRTIEQVKIYTLVLNPMTDRFEATRIAAIAYDRQKLEDFYNGEKVEQYRDDGRWAKTFRKGGPLEWFNPLEWSDYVGIGEEWTTQEAVQDFINNSFGSTMLIQ